MATKSPDILTFIREFNACSGSTQRQKDFLNTQLRLINALPITEMLKPQWGDMSSTEQFSIILAYIAFQANSVITLVRDPIITQQTSTTLH